MNTKKIILFILFPVLLFSFGFNVSASELCSKNGYTVATINGIFTDEQGANDNLLALKKKLGSSFKNENIDYRYLYNPSHLSGFGDIADVIAQGLFKEKSDYDLTNMLVDASQKVTTQKLLLVGHSQGNFYANNFYGKVAGQAGGVPQESIGVYGVASPASFVAGSGKYVTSSSDKVIKTVAGTIFNILPPNVDIALQSGDDVNGHDFSGVYLKYQSDRIVSDIKSSLDKLKNNYIQNSDSVCINPPELSFKHKIEGVALAIADPAVNLITSTAIGAYDVGVYIASRIDKLTLAIVNSFSSNLPASAIGSVANNTNTVTLELKTEEKPVTKTKTPEVKEAPEIIPTKEEHSTQKENIVTEITPTPEPQTTTLAIPLQSVSSGIGGHSSPPPAPVVNTPAIIPDTTAPVITMNGNANEYIVLNSTYTDPGATVLDDVDGVLVATVSSTVNTSVAGDYVITYTATDSAGNTATANRNIKVSTYKYIPRSSFGANNGDGNDWQVWAFNGSNIYDWTDTYVNNYLHEQFKIQAYSGGFWCSQCMERGIFNHDPQKGFEASDFVRSSLEDSPQNNSDGITYDVDIQWDATGYTHTISHSGTTDFTGYTNVSNITANTWVGWDRWDNAFTTFPSGTWTGNVYASPNGRLGGINMMLQPYPVYVP